MTVDSALGQPNEHVTHWGISRVQGWRRNEKQKRIPILERITSPRPDGVHINEWPLAECTLDIIRERWGVGEYRTHWFITDLEAADPSDRRRSGGHGNIFRLGELEDFEEPSPVAVAGPVHPPSEGVNAQMDFAIRMMELSDMRAQRQIDNIVRQVPKSENGESAQILAHIARLESKMEADRLQREIEDRHRAELARKDQEIADLKRAKERAEEEASKPDDSPTFDPDLSIWEQLPIVLVNGLTGLAKTHPEVATTIMEKGMELWERRKSTVSRETTPAPPVAAPPPAMAPPRAPVGAPPVVMHVVPRRQDDPLTPSRTAKASDPSPAPPPRVAPPAAAPEPPESGVGVSASP